MLQLHNDLDIKPGMWVRFEANGRLVVGVVGYVRPNGSGHPYVYTDQGTVPLRAILEARG